ncbi:MAG: ABC transporter permease, partial [Acidobacteriota bacterium]
MSGLQNIFTEVGRISLVFARVLVWTPRAPYDLPELFRQMVRVGVQSLPVVLLTALFTGMVMALQIFTVLVRFGAEGYV